MAEHSSIGASSADRWFNCAGSVALIPQAPEEKPSKFAFQGTAAHWVLEQCLGTDKDPWDYEGEVYEKDDLTHELKQEDIEAVIEAIELIDELRAGGKYILLKEVLFDLECIYPGLFGTGDILLIKADLSHLIVLDYKHGAGKLVHVHENKQLLYYGLGGIKKASDEHAPGMLELMGWGNVFKKVTVGIIQPRCEHRDGPLRLWDVPAARLDEFADELKQKARATQQKDAPLAAGDHCQWCRAKVICPQPMKMAQEVAKTDFSVIEDVELPKPETLTIDEVAKVIALKPIMDSWFKSALAYGQTLLESGQEFPGFKIVKTKPHRKWIDEDETLETLGMVIASDELYTKKLKSPAQMEKQLGKKHKVMVSDLCFNPEGENVLAPEHDKRPAIECGPDNDFDKLNN